jgi:HNH endonuclease
VHIPISQLRDMPGAPELEDAWIKAKLGEPEYLAGKDAEVAACDAMAVPVVTGHADMAVIDKIIALARAAGPADLSSSAWQVHRFAIARLAIDFVSGPGGLASALRTGLMELPYNTPSLPLDIGFSDSIPAHIRRAVILRDKHCGWPGGCDRPASASDVHHIVHKNDGGETSLQNCGLFCEYHHEICIHRWGWKITLHPDGTMEARSPGGDKVLRSHAPPMPPM